MRKVKIADLKSKLSSHLREVRSGKEILILDRQSPIARLIPLEKSSVEFTLIPPSSKKNLKDLFPHASRKTQSKATSSKKPAAKRKKPGQRIPNFPKLDIVKILREDRDSRW